MTFLSLWNDKIDGVIYWHVSLMNINMKLEKIIINIELDHLKIKLHSPAYLYRHKHAHL